MNYFTKYKKYKSKYTKLINNLNNLDITFDEHIDYKNKYLKYKNKYVNQKGGVGYYNKYWLSTDHVLFNKFNNENYERIVISSNYNNTTQILFHSHFCITNISYSSNY